MTPHIPLPAHRRERGPSVADGYKFLVVKRLSRRLLDRSINAFLPTTFTFGAANWRWCHRNFVDIFCTIKLESMGVVAEILHLAVLIQYRLVTDGHTMKANTALA